MTSDPNTRTSVPYPIESVDNALRLIHLLWEHEELGVTAAARALGVAPSTAHRLLAMLVFRGFAVQNPRRTYQAGPARPQDKRRLHGPDDVADLVRPLLGPLCNRLEETVHFAVLRGTAAHFVSGMEYQQGLRVASRAGMMMPAHCTAAGKALLSELSPAEIDANYPRGLPNVYGPAATDLPSLKRHLLSVRKAGFAVSREENERGVVGVAVVVRDETGRAHGALAAGVPTARCPNTRLPEIARHLHAAAAAARPALSALSESAAPVPDLEPQVAH